MTEQHYAFIKNNRVENIAVFASQDEELADRIAQEQGYDDAVWIGENIITKYSEYNSIDGSFIPPTNEYLISIGILEPIPEQENV